MLEVDWELVPKELDVLCMEDLQEPQRNIDLDAQLGHEVAVGVRRPLVRVWRSAHTPGIGVSRKDVSSPAGSQAMKTLMDEGCNVIVRQTGGTAVPQGDGVLHLSLLFPRLARKTTTDAYYRLLCDPFLQWFAGYGLSAYTGALPGSYCDGTYNVLVDGRKLIGTAQAWRGGLAGFSSAHPGYVLAHACVTVDVDFTQATRWMNRFYELAGDPYRVDEAVSVSLRTLTETAWQGLTREAAGGQAARQLEAFLTQYFTQHGVDVMMENSVRPHLYAE